MSGRGWSGAVTALPCEKKVKPAGEQPADLVFEGGRSFVPGAAAAAPIKDHGRVLRDRPRSAV